MHGNMGVCQSFKRVSSLFSVRWLDSDSSVPSLVTFAFKTRETGHLRFASRATFSNVVRSIGTRPLTAR